MSVPVALEDLLESASAVHPESPRRERGVRMQRVVAARRLLSYGFYDQPRVLDVALERLAEDLHD